MGKTSITIVKWSGRFTRQENQTARGFRAAGFSESPESENKRTNRRPVHMGLMKK
jgi:hypothetical protein